MKVYLGRTMTIHGKVPDDDWNKLRDVLGLPLRAEGGVMADGYCQVDGATITVPVVTVVTREV